MTSKQGLMTINLDMKDSYDKLEQKFIHKCFIELGF